MKIENDLGKDAIGRLVWRIAIPSMLAQFVSVLYSLVDRMYIGHIADIGDRALAGVGVCGPIVTMVGSVAFLVGVGGSPLMSIRMGEGDRKAARQIVANCFLLLCVFSLFLMLLLFPLRIPMLRLFGASETTLPYAATYFSIYLLGTPFALLSVGMNQFITCQGFAKVAMKSVVLGAICNIVLDPVFIFMFHLDVAGAAIATVLSQLFSCLYVLHFLLRPELPVRITLGGYRLQTMVQVLSIGCTPFLITAIDNVMIIAMNAVLQQYGGASQGDFLITCATIVQSFMMVVTMPLGGISGGTQSILGFNFGARRPDRVRKAQKYLVLFCAGYTTVLFILARVAGPLFVSLFTKDPEVTEKAVWAIRVCTLFIIPLGVQYELVDGFTALGKVRYSLPLSFFRKLVYFIALFWLPAHFGAQAAFYAQPLSDFLGPLVTVVVYLTCIRKVLDERKPEVALVGETSQS